MIEYKIKKQYYRRGDKLRQRFIILIIKPIPTWLRLITLSLLGSTYTKTYKETTCDWGDCITSTIHFISQEEAKEKVDYLCRVDNIVIPTSEIVDTFKCEI